MATGRGLLCADCFDQTGRVREVYLHVGPMKTGSTFLQDLLWRHRDDLARQGYNHPGAHANEMWLATNDLQDGAFVNYEMPQASGVWARGLQARPGLRRSFGDLARGPGPVNRGAH